MLEETFFCIRPYIFEKREIIKKMITDSGLKITKSKVIWLTLPDLRVIYGKEEPSTYFDASIKFMTEGFSEAGIIEGEDVINKLIKLSSDNYIPNKSELSTIRAIFGKTNPINFNGLDYYLNPLHRSKTKIEAKREVSLFKEQIDNRSPFKIISDMLLKLYQKEDLECVYHYHIKSVVSLGLELTEEFGGNKEVVELACLLHDIASLTNNDKFNHHVESAKYAEKILSYFSYSSDIINNVMHCIETHRGSYLLQKMTKEAEIVCSADGIANISNAPLLYYFAYGRKKLSFEDGVKKIRNKIESSYAKISDFAKSKIEREYKEWLKLFS